MHVYPTSDHDMDSRSSNGVQGPLSSELHHICSRSLNPLSPAGAVFARETSSSFEQPTTSKIIRVVQSNLA